MASDNPSKTSEKLFRQLAHVLDMKGFTPDSSLLTSLIHSLPLNIYAKDVKGRFIFANRHYCNSVGKKYSDIIGKDDYQIHPGEMADKYRKDDRKIMDSRQPKSIEEEWQSIGGQKGYIQVIKAPLFDNEKRNKVVGTVGMFWDITDRKQAEIDLAEERSLLRTIVDNLPDAIYVKDINSRFLLANAGVAKLMGADSPEDLIGKTDFDFYSRDDAEKFYNDEQRIIKSDKMLYNLEENIHGADGQSYWLLTTKVPLKNIKGEVNGIIGMGHDITERKKQEEERLQLETQLQHAQRVETVGTLVAGIAHDFNNHLSVINGYAELLSVQQNLPPSEQKQYIDKIVVAGKRAAALTNQLMAFSRKQLIQPKVVDFNALLTDIVQLLKPVLGELVTVVLDLDPDLHHVLIDPTQVEQVIMNLAANSGDAMTDGGTFQVTTKNIRLDSSYNDFTAIGLPPGDYILLTIRDTGPGIDNDIRERIFEPFFSTKAKYKGTGLGLSTVLGIIQQNKGTILLKDEEPPGTTFEIYLPGNREKVEKTTLEHVTEIPGGNETIFIAEDEQNVRMLADTILTAKGYRVFTASDGRQALDEITKNKLHIDLLLTDIIMPHMNGKELAETLRKKYPDMKVLFMSGYSDDALSRYDITREGADYIQKPFKTESLTRKIRHLLDI